MTRSSAIKQQFDEIEIHLPTPHKKQKEFLSCEALRIMIKAGRRGGKTVGVGIKGVEDYLKGHRVLYGAPTAEQVDRFWTTVKRALHNPIKRGIFKKNESERYIEPASPEIIKAFPAWNPEMRIKAKTAWNADSLRGDYADKLILDEYQLMNEETWNSVGAPMMLDTNGQAVFIYTPPSLKSRSVSKATDPQHASKLFKKIQQAMKDGSTRSKAFHFTSMDNPYLSTEALDEISQDMTSVAYRMEILAEDIDEAPGALWTRKIIEDNRVLKAPDYIASKVVAVDPSATSEGDEAGIITCGAVGDDGYIFADDTVQGSPLTWAKTAVVAYHRGKCDYIVAEANNGGEMVSTVINQVDPAVPVVLVHASRAKRTRAEPISAKAEKGKIHHVGNFPQLEDELCLWVPGDESPNRLDAMVWGMTKLLVRQTDGSGSVDVSTGLAGGADW